MALFGISRTSQGRLTIVGAHAQAVSVGDRCDCRPPFVVARALGAAALTALEGQLASPNDIGGLLISALGPMGVDLHRGGAVGMAEPRGHGRYRHASVEELRCLEVAEVV